jgi:hypothetical protein
MKKFDVKSLAIGVIAGAVLTLALGADAGRDLRTGRFQVHGTASHAVILDTATGQVWSKFMSQNGGTSDGDFANPKLPR